MILSLKNLWKEKPLVVLLWLSFFIRLVSVIFSKGFGMHDDHFIIIESPQYWLDKVNLNNIPGCAQCEPSGRSFFYPGFHYLLFYVLESIGVFNPQIKMFFVRLIHALFSILIVYFGYKIALIKSNKRTASQVGLILALLWFMPFLSVRNLVEFVCIPFMMAAIWFILKSEHQKSTIFNYLLAGLFFGLAFNTRYQVAFFIGGACLAMLFSKKIKGVIFIFLGFVFTVALFEGLIDYVIWGRPFAEMLEYINYNATHAYDYLINPWYTYLLFIAGVLIPPISIMLFWGYLYNWKNNLVLFLSILLFLGFHSFFPNKQERFIIPIIPFIVIAGFLGWEQFITKSKYWISKKNLHKYLWIFFWTINLLLLPFISLTYSKKARVESLTYLSKYKNIESILVEDVNNGYAKQLPLFYLGQWPFVFELNKKYTVDSIAPLFTGQNAQKSPDFIMFYGDKNIEDRVGNVKKVFPKMRIETTIESGFIDVLLYKLNPNNLNQTIYIYNNR